MGAKSNACEVGWLNLLFRNITFAGIGDAGGLLQSVGDGDLFVSLHTAALGEGGDQESNEATYTGYGREAVARPAGWTVSAGDPSVAENAAAITFGTCTVGTESITHVAVGTAVSGAGIMLYSVLLTAPLPIVVGVIPEFNAGDLNFTET